MNLYALLGISFIPAVLFFCLACLQNKNLKIRYCAFSCVLGILTVIPTSLIQFFVLGLPVFNSYSFESVFVTAIIFNGLIEESMKLLFICFIPQKKQTFSAFFCCCLLYGLVAGGFESVVYVVRKFQEITVISGKEILIELLVQRIFSAQLIHTFCAGLSGLYLWFFKHKNTKFLPFIYAFTLHGIYNFFASFTSGYKWLALVAIVFAALQCRNFYTEAVDKIDSKE